MRRGGVVMSVMGTLLLAMTLDAVAGPGTEGVHLFDNLGHV